MAGESQSINQVSKVAPQQQTERNPVRNRRPRTFFGARRSGCDHDVINVEPLPYGRVAVALEPESYP